MAAPTPTVLTSPAVDAAKRLRTFNGKILETSKGLGSAYVDAYEKVLTSLIQVEAKAAAATHSEWVATMTQEHTDFVTEFLSSYTAAARALVR